VLLRSTVLPYTVETVVVSTLERASGKRVGKGFGLVVNPEFLREGSSIEDFDRPQFTLLGTEDQRSPAIAQRLYGFLKAPVIVTTDLRLNEPRYASLPNIMKAKKKPIADKTPADYGVDIAPRLQVLKTTEPPGRKSGAKVGSVAELVAKLKDEAGVLG